MAHKKIEAVTDPFYESALYYILRDQKCSSRAEAVRVALMIAARAKGWRGPGHEKGNVNIVDERYLDREERLRRFL